MRTSPATVSITATQKSRLDSRWQKLVLTLHVLTSVAWLGAVLAFTALATKRLRGAEVDTIRAAYLAMDIVTRSVIVPLCFAALATGIASSLASPWGVFRHYWTAIKLLLTLGAPLLLLLHAILIHSVAGGVSKPSFSIEQYRDSSTVTS